MKFSRIIGKIDPQIIAAAELKLTKVFIELAARIDNDQVGSKLGGDPLIFALVVPVEHVATLNIPTAATDGKRFFWNPNWIIEKSLVGNRMACYHESGHAIYMHPQRRGTRLPKLWNFAIDYIVNGMIMDDLKIRLKNNTVLVHQTFVSGFGNYLTLPQCVAMFKNPFQPIPDMDGWIPEPHDPNDQIVSLPKPDDDRELTEEEKKELEKRSKKYKYYFADPNLPEEMKRPEKIYDLLFSLLPQCPECGKMGIYKKPSPSSSSSEDKGKGKDKGKEKGKDKNSGENGEKSDQKCQHGGCSTCGDDYVDIFDIGDTVDEHIDATESPEEMTKRISDAIRTAKQMAGRVPQGLEDELGILSAPRIRWQDFIRTRLVKVRSGNSKNDWTKFRSRPMFAGLMVPKRINHVANFACLLDTSGSMSKDDMAFGISQLASLDERSEGIIVPADAQIYYEQATKIRRCKAEELNKVKIIGRGGTLWAPFFVDYEKYLGKQDFLIIISDMFLLSDDIANMKDPKIPVYWLCTSGSDFNPPFGKVFQLRN